MSKFETGDKHFKIHARQCISLYMPSCVMDGTSLSARQMEGMYTSV